MMVSFLKNTKKKKKKVVKTSEFNDLYQKWLSVQEEDVEEGSVTFSFWDIGGIFLLQIGMFGMALVIWLLNICFCSETVKGYEPG